MSKPGNKHTKEHAPLLT